MTIFLILIVLAGLLYLLYRLYRHRQSAKSQAEFITPPKSTTIAPKSPQPSDEPKESVFPLPTEDDSLKETPSRGKPDDSAGEKGSATQSKSAVSDAANIIDQYLDRYENDRLQYELNNFFFKQFDLPAEIEYPKFKIRPITSLDEIEIDAKDIEEGKAYLINKFKHLTKSNNSIRWDDALQFLHRNAEINANLRGLAQIESKVSNRELFDELFSAQKRRMQELIDTFG